MPKRKTSICPICFKGELVRREKTLTKRFRGRSITYKQPGAWCTHCDEGILTGTDALATSAKLLQWRYTIIKLTEQAPLTVKQLAKNPRARTETTRARRQHAAEVKKKAAVDTARKARSARKMAE